MLYEVITLAWPTISTAAASEGVLVIAPERSPAPVPASKPNRWQQPQVTVITSYSIHYTKLYEKRSTAADRTSPYTTSFFQLKFSRFGST